jgi:hypothetical protein
MKKKRHVMETVWDVQPDFQRHSTRDATKAMKMTMMTLKN